MRFRGLMISCASAGAIAACDIPRERFFRPDAAVDGPPEPGALARRAYIKASNTGAKDSFGHSVALSADGSTLAVGAPREASNRFNPANDAAPDAGAVYVFTRSDTQWLQQAYIKAAQPDLDDFFGASVALSADGSTLAVGALSEDGAATVIDGDQTDDAAPAAGAAYVFLRTGIVWSQESYIKPFNLNAYDRFGTSIALSADGSTLAVGAAGEGSASHDPLDNSQSAAGAVYVFTRRGASWTHDSYLKAQDPTGMEEFGAKVALSGDGATLAVGTAREANFGKVVVFERTGGTWSRHLDLRGIEAADGFGGSLALSHDGSILAAGAPRDDREARNAGSVHVYTRTAMVWSKQPTTVTAIGAGEDDDFGHSVALSADGTVLMVGASLEDGPAVGIDGDPASNTALDAGAVYLFGRTGTAWTQRSYVKASNTQAGDNFGTSVALSRDGAILAVGAAAEDSSATGVNGEENDDTEEDAGAVYIYR